MTTLTDDSIRPTGNRALGDEMIAFILMTVLLVIGLSVVARIPRQRAAIAAIIVWVIGALPALLGALRAS